MITRHLSASPVVALRAVAKVLTLIAALWVFSIAHAQSSLAGTVVDKQGKPKPNVAVDVLGPTSAYTETDASGRFAVRVRPGSYVIRIRDGNRRAEFPEQVSGDRQLRLQLSW